MDILWKINIVNQLIKEDSDSTIRDYLNLVSDLEQIELKTKIIHRHAKPKLNRGIEKATTANITGPYGNYC